jgi:hypothetical protein
LSYDCFFSVATTDLEKDATKVAAAATTSTSGHQPVAPKRIPHAAPAAPSKPAATKTMTNGASHLTNGHLDKATTQIFEVPKSLGSDVEAVAWVNEGIQKAFCDEKISQELIKKWLSSLTQYTKSSGAEVRLIFAN